MARVERPDTSAPLGNKTNTVSVRFIFYPENLSVEEAFY